MASVEAGSLRVKLAMDAGEFSTGTKQAGNMIASLENQILGFATSWQGALTGAVLAITAFAFSAKDRFAQAIDDISQIGKTAQKIGIAVEALSQFQYAAERSGVSSDVFANSIKKLSVNLQDSLKGGSSEATTALKNMGVSVIDTNGKLKSTTSIILAIADKFESYKDSANKTAIAVALFGRAGTEMIPFLNKGSDGIEKLTEKADKFGMTVNSQTVAAVKSLSGEMRDITDSVNGFYRKLVVDLAPSLVEISKVTKDWVNNLKLNKEHTEQASIVTKEASIEFFALASACKIATTYLVGYYHVIQDIGQLDFSKMSEDVAETSRKVDETLAQMAIKFAEHAGKAQGDMAKAAMTHKLISDGMLHVTENWSTKTIDAIDKVNDKIDAPSLAKSKLGEMLETTTKQVAALQALQTRTSGKPLLSLDATVNESLDEYNKKLKVTQALVTAVKGSPKLNTDIGAAIALEQYNKALAYGKQLTEEYLTPAQKIEKAQQKINEAYRIGAINATTLGRAQAENSVYSQKNLTALADVTASALDKIFGQTKAVAIATALINTYKGVTTALAEYPPPISFAMAGLQLAAGMAQVMNIRSQGKSGGAAAPSTAIDSGAAATAAAQTAAPANNSTLLVQGISPGQMFSGDVVRDLAGRLLDFQKDGGKVVLA